MISIICFALAGILLLSLPFIKARAHDEYYYGLKRAGFLK